MIGPVANSVCIVAGSILGALCGPVLSQEFRKKIMNVFSCITLGIGVTMLSKGDSLPPVVLSLLFGTALGELTRFESLVMKGGLQGGGAVQAERQSQGRQVRNAVRDGVPRSVRRGDGPFCVSGLGIIGSMREGLTGECSLLLIKGVLDLFTAMLIRRASAVWWACWPFRSAPFSLPCCSGPRAHAVHHADHVCGFLRLRRHHHARRGGCARWGSCRSLSSVCCPVCFSSCRCPHYGSRLCR